MRGTVRTPIPTRILALLLAVMLPDVALQTVAQYMHIKCGITIFPLPRPNRMSYVCEVLGLVTLHTGLRPEAMRNDGWKLNCFPCAGFVIGVESKGSKGFSVGVQEALSLRILKL